MLRFNHNPLSMELIQRDIGEEQIDIAPADHGLVGRQLLGLPVEAQVLGESLVDARDVSLPGRSLLPGDRQSGVHLRDEGLVGVQVGEDVGLGDRTLRLHRGVGAAAGGQDGLGLSERDVERIASRLFELAQPMSGLPSVTPNVACGS